ncbi:hypothetical protein L9F63_009080 [Diploptera punctata]|uniref:DUF4485 domain-containing protein n=1 Tax=Diploptera punctata TaxID=6984 RepID=A0AAD7Z3X4_DIPPU|nr:hypothetical protein L9F63_009080 [Diploptera punctata]
MEKGKCNPESNNTTTLKPVFEDKLDEDFITILSTVRNNICNLNSEADRNLAQLWVDKLSGEAYDGVELKRSRNIYLTRLASQIPDPDSRLNAPFDEPPPDGKLTSPDITFKLQSPEEKRPEWLRELIQEDQLTSDISHTSEDGRTYLATHTMKDGIGAFGYLAVTVANDGPLWVGAGEDASSSASKTSTKRKRPVICRDPASPQALLSRISEERNPWANVAGQLKKITNRKVIENIQQMLEKRHSPEGRDGLLHYYDILLENITKEMDTCGCGKTVHNAHVQHLMDKLERDLEEAGENVCECEMPPAEKRMYMLELLHKRTEDRLKAVKERERALDQMERTLESLDDEEESEDDLNEDALWLNTVEQGPSEQNVKRLLNVYPPELVERFAELLAIWRHEMVRRCRNRHENIVATMEKELKVEANLGVEKYKEARDTWMRAAKALQEVQAAQQKAKESAELESLMERQSSAKHARGRTKLINEIQGEFSEAQQRFDDERGKGEKLREQIIHETQRIENATELSEAAIDQLQADGEALRTEIMQLDNELEDQETRMADLDQLIENNCYE